MTHERQPAVTRVPKKARARQFDGCVRTGDGGRP